MPLVKDALLARINNRDLAARLVPPPQFRRRNLARRSHHRTLLTRPLHPYRRRPVPMAHMGPRLRREGDSCKSAFRLPEFSARVKVAVGWHEGEGRMSE